jgi:riboflavin-specific deaminase-like protein
MRQLAGEATGFSSVCDLPDHAQSARNGMNRCRRPFVTVNFAVTWDGKVSTRNRTPSDFSSKRDKKRLLEIRSTGDALMAGRATIAADNMRMGLPDAKLRAARIRRGQTEFPLRVIVTNRGNIDPKLQVFRHDFSPIHVFSTERMPLAVRRRLEKIATLHFQKGSSLNLANVLETLLGEHNVKRVVCEGGPTIFKALLADDLVDEICLTLCPRIFGGAKALSLTGAAGDFLPKSTLCRISTMEVVEDECFLRYEVIR